MSIKIFPKSNNRCFVNAGRDDFTEVINSEEMSPSDKIKLARYIYQRYPSIIRQAESGKTIISTPLGPKGDVVDCTFDPALTRERLNNLRFHSEQASKYLDEAPPDIYDDSNNQDSDQKNKDCPRCPECYVDCNKCRIECPECRKEVTQRAATSGKAYQPNMLTLMSSFSSSFIFVILSFAILYLIVTKK